MRRIAVTGGVAEGKSTVLRYLSELGCSTASADDVSREIFNDPAVQAGLADLLGVSGAVRPEDLRLAIATKPIVRRGVNALMHPRVLDRLRSLQANVIEVPLLIETCLQGEFERVWVVTCGPEEQLRRLEARVGSKREAVRLIGTQLPSIAKCAFADIVVRTNQPEQTVVRFVSEAVRS